MALTKPIVNELGILKPFDATEEYAFKFDIYGGDQSVKTQLQIYRSDNNLAYDKIRSGYELKHIIAANRLVNGVQYKARIRTYNINGEYSEWSEWITFKCLSLAIVKINNIKDGEVKNQAEVFKGDYLQLENSMLESYKFILYGESKQVLKVSPEMLDRDLEYLFDRFENNKIYYIELKTKSVDNLESSSGLIKFITNYIQPKVQNVLKLENDEDSGRIKASASIKRVLGWIKCGNINYENGQGLDARNGRVVFDKENGLKINEDFTLQILCNAFNEETPFLELKVSENECLRILCKKNIIYMQVVINNEVLYQLKDELKDSNNRDIYIWIQRVGSLFNFKVEELYSNIETITLNNLKIFTKGFLINGETIVIYPKKEEGE